MDGFEQLASDPLRNAYGAFVGFGADGRPSFAGPEQSVLVIGPPRSGKTTGILIPNVLAAGGPVVVTSTKPDVLTATASSRRRIGACLLFDPSGRTEAPRGVERVAWSPLASAAGWDGALLAAQALVTSARPGAVIGESYHWTERAQALLAPCLHAAALDGLDMGTLASLVDRREGRELLAVLARHDTTIPLDTLEGVLRTDERELSGIWSTASSVLAAYRSAEAREAARGVPIDLDDFVAGRNTLFVCAGSDEQRHAAPIVAGLVTEARRAGYGASARRPLGVRDGRPSLLLALDEVANVAPLPDLPTIVAEGGGQGVVTLACVQDLAQAVERWGRLGEGFLSLFNVKLVLPGIGDTRTLEALSLLAGEHDVPSISVTSGPRAPGLAGLLGRRIVAQTTVSTRPRRRLPVDAVARGQPGRAICFDGTVPSVVALRAPLGAEWLASAQRRERALRPSPRPGPWPGSGPRSEPRRSDRFEPPSLGR